MSDKRKETASAFEQALKKALRGREEKMDASVPDELKDEVMQALSFLEFFADMADLFAVRFFRAELDFWDSLTLSEEEE